MWGGTFMLLLVMVLSPSLVQGGVVSAWRAGLLAGNESRSSGVFRSWSTGMGGFVEVVRELEPRVEAACRVTGRAVLYDRYRGDFASIPEVNWTASGENLRAVDARVALRMTTAGRRAALFFGPTAGVLVADVGKVTLTGRYVSGRIAGVWTAPETDEVVTKGLMGANAGIVFRGESGRLDAGFEGSCLISTGEVRMSWFEFAFFLGSR